MTEVYVEMLPNDYDQLAQPLRISTYRKGETIGSVVIEWSKLKIELEKFHLLQE